MKMSNNYNDPGPDLDALVARDCGWKKIYLHYHSRGRIYAGDSHEVKPPHRIAWLRPGINLGFVRPKDFVSNLPDFSTDIAAAMGPGGPWKKLVEMDCEPMVTESKSLCGIRVKIIESTRTYLQVSETIPHAICIALRVIIFRTQNTE